MLLFLLAILLLVVFPVKYRSKAEIVADVLSVAREGAKKTHIMYRGNLSYKLLNVYLDAAMKAGFICFNCEDDRYLLTKKGKMFLEKFKKHSKRLRGLEKKLSETKSEIASLEQVCFAADLPNSDNSVGKVSHNVNKGKRAENNKPLSKRDNLQRKM